MKTGLVLNGVLLGLVIMLLAGIAGFVIQRLDPLEDFARSKGYKPPVR
jgi:hypothetical protein